MADEDKLLRTAISLWIENEEDKRVSLNAARLWHHQRAPDLLPVCIQTADQMRELKVPRVEERRATRVDVIVCVCQALSDGGDLIPLSLGSVVLLLLQFDLKEVELQLQLLPCHS